MIDSPSKRLNLSGRTQSEAAVQVAALSIGRMAVDGRLGEVANDSFGASKFDEPDFR